MSLTKSIKRKHAIFKSLKKCMTEADSLIANPDNQKTVTIEKILIRIKGFWDEYEPFANEILDSIADTDSTTYDSELEKHSDLNYEMEYTSELEALLNEAKRMMSQSAQGGGPADAAVFSRTQASVSSPERSKSRLPKLQIRYYDGDPLKWLEFWDSYKSTIHERDLPGVEKLQYLQSYLRGDAERFLAGYPLSNDNYDVAVEALKKRFGNLERIKQAHITELLDVPVSGKEVHELRRAYDECERHIRCLDALGLKEQDFGQFFAPIMLSKFPYFLRVNLNLCRGSDVWTLEKLRDSLSAQIMARESEQGKGDKPPQRQQQVSSPRNFGYQHKSFAPPSKSTIRTTSSFPVNSAKVHRCVYCGGPHFPDQCNQVKDVESRKAALVRQSRCTLCLSSGHRTRECNNIRPCQYCRKSNHNRSLCLKNYPARPTSKPPPTQTQLNVYAKTFAPPVSSASTSAQSAALFSTTNAGKTGYLHTAQASVEGNKRRSKVRLLLDPGSTVTFITHRLAQILGAKYVGNEAMSTAGFQTTAPKKKDYKVYEIKLFFTDGSHVVLRAYGTESISCPITRYAHDVEANPVLKEVVLADTLCNQDESVELDFLVGGDYYYDIVLEGQTRYPTGVVLLNTKLGYVVAGRVPENRSVQSIGCMLTHNYSSDVTDDLERLWRLEAIGIKDPVIATDDERALQLFNESIEFNNEAQRYMVSWPWNENKEALQDNFAKAYGRLNSLLKRLQRQPEVLKRYTETIDTQLQKGIVEPAPAVPDGKVYYVPHHEVVTPERETTKLRVVYDGSCKPGKHEVSLNDCLMRGPVILEDLCGLLIRFRLKKIAVIADLEKAFLQVGLHPDQRDVTRFLWVKDPGKAPMGDNLVHYRFGRVSFGMNASPFLLAATIQHLCNTVGTEVAKKVASNIYLDNVIAGVSDASEANQFYCEAKQIFSSASMNLREWYSNDADFMRALPEADKGRSDRPKVLGLTWDLTSDVLSCSSSKGSPENVTSKRKLLRAVAQAYDPCGFFSPVIMRGKVLLQKLWEEKVTWDEILSQENQTSARSVVRDIQAISQLSVPRCVISENPEKQQTSYQIHCFADASKLAFSTAVYLRQQIGNQVRIDLLFSKSRVAPVKERNIPRLELLGASLAAKVTSFIMKEVRMPIAKIFVWLDNQSVLHWILGRTVSMPFVRNRVCEIRKHEKFVWRYVPTETNPADIPSRGSSCEDLKDSKLWWYGPEWLRQSEDNWPENIVVSAVAVEATAMVSIVKPATPTRVEVNSVYDIGRHSNLAKAVGVAANTLRFIDILREKTQRSRGRRFAQSGQAYREQAMQNLVSEAQHRHEQESNFKCTVKRLRIYKDENGIQRCKGRLQDELSKDPILLPRNDTFTKLVILDFHNRLNHAEASHLLAELRYDYWIPQARLAIKATLKNCMICRRHRGPPYRIPDAPPLPPFRTRIDRPFACTGIDYLGPLHIRNSGGTQKVWLCLMTCGSTRAVHLEVVENMSTEHFLLAMRRFTSWYGSPKVLISDNAQQFHMSDRVFKKILESKDIQDFSKRKGIEWKFVTEKAPWMGGFYERMVGVVKKSLKATIHMSRLSFTELQTIVCEVCTTVNTRPLVYVEDDIGFRAISPSHLLMRHPSIFNEVPATQVDEYFPRPGSTDQLVLTWKRLQKMLEKFWHMWQIQYLIALRDSAWKHPQHHVSKQSPAVGDVVLVHEDKVPRTQWQIAKIKDVLPSADGQVRSVVVLLPDKRTLRRPLKLLFPLASGVVSRGVSSLQGDCQQVDNLLSRESRPRREKAIEAAKGIKRCIAEEEQADAELTVV